MNNIPQCRQRQRQVGAVSIFVVIFCMLLVTIITVSFVGVMIRNQQQVMSADLSDSAHDSALAGVEDAKRLLLRYRECLATPSATGCDTVIDAVDGGRCDTVAKGLYGKTDGSPVVVQRSSADDVSEALNQAYTCVKIDYTGPISGEIGSDSPELIAIDTASRTYNKIRISWFTQEDAKKAGGSDGAEVGLSPGTFLGLPPDSEWSPDDKIAPPILRAQWIQTGATFSLSDFSTDSADRNAARSNASTVFLYPAGAGVESGSFTAVDLKGGKKSPQGIECRSGVISEKEYACQVELMLPSPVGGGTRKNGHLRLLSLYGTTSYKVEVLNGSTVVDTVRPQVDSTGRANNVYRRVLAEIDFNPSLSGIRAGMEVDNSGRETLCKDFMVTNSSYVPGTGDCGSFH